MTVLEIVLLIAGVLCVAVSFLVKDGSGEKLNSGDAQSKELTEQDKERIRKQVDEILEDMISNISERTEAQLDKISNTKILEMNDYAETIMGEINRNHNETVFLYDMLNEKAKEVKSTVKDVNIAKREVARMQYESTITAEEQKLPKSTATEGSGSRQENSKIAAAYGKENPTGAQANGIIASGVKLQQASKAEAAVEKGSVTGYSRNKHSKDLAKERLIELVRKNTENSKELQRTVQIKVEPLKVAETGNQKVTAKEEKEVEPAKAENVKPKTSVKKAEPEKTEAAETVSSKNEAAETVSAKPASASKKSEKTKAAEPTEKETVSKTAKSENETAAKPKTTRKKTAKKAQEEDMAEPTEQKQPEDINVSIQFDKSVNKNDAIIDMYKQGMSNKDIAKQLNLGIGEVKLMVDLFKNTK